MLAYFKQQYLERGNSKLCLHKTVFKEYLISFLMVSRLIDFARVVLKLLMLKVCGIIGVTKIEFSNISGTERVNKYLYLKLLNRLQNLYMAGTRK